MYLAAPQERCSISSQVSLAHFKIADGYRGVLLAVTADTQHLVLLELKHC